MRCRFLTLILCLLLANLSFAVEPTQKERATAEKWFNTTFDGKTVPFSFVYGGKPSAELLPSWDKKTLAETLDEKRISQTISWTDPATGLEVVLKAIRFTDFPTVEWTVSFKNSGKTDTPILEKVLSADFELSRGEKSPEFLLHYSVGASSGPRDYAPAEKTLAPGTTQTFAPNGGRPTNGAWPYYNLQWGDEGVILAVGWPGQWESSFKRDADRKVHFSAGQQLIHAKLLPGETVAAPRVIVQFYQESDWLRAQNVWRRWMMAHNMPRPGGKLPKPMLLAYTGRMYEEMFKATEANQTICFNRFKEEKIPLDYWWTDAGWYPCEKNWGQTGTWEVDRKRFPRGLKPITDLAHSHGMKTLLWFEPERVMQRTGLSKNHPEWILGGAFLKLGHPALLNLGNPEAQAWVTDRVDQIMTDEGIDLYRQDFNMDPLNIWRKNDAPDRQGITENHHVSGYLGFWDELARRHPDSLFDSCASGGRRNDPESMRRAVPLWRSDHAYMVVANQGMTHGISLWIPYHGTGTTASTNSCYYGGGKTEVEPYAFWSTATPSMNLTLDIRQKEMNYELLRKLIGQWKRMNQFYYGDYYPLWPYSLNENVWIGWQFHDPAIDAGMVQAFRRKDAPYLTANVALHALKADGKYRVTNLTTDDTFETTGSELLNKGLSITIDEKPGAVVFVYESVQ
jgi:alpha-galactosidase